MKILKYILWYLSIANKMNMFFSHLILKPSHINKPKKPLNSKFYTILLLLGALMSITIGKAQIVIDNGFHINLNNGVYLNAEGNINNNGNISSDNLSYVKLLGGQQEISGTVTTSFSNLIIDGTGKKILNNISTQKSEILSALIFNAQNIELNNNDLILSASAQIQNPANNKYIVTNSTGSLIKKALPTGVNFLFPVGDSHSSYKPVIINPVTVTDTFAVRVVNGIMPADQTAVQKTYIIKSSHPITSEADITLGWNIPDEGSSFVSAQSLMWQKDNGNWSLLPNIAGATTNLPATNWYYKAEDVQFLSSQADSFIIKSSAPPVIIAQPQPKTICETETTTFLVSATGLGVLSYQWQINCSGTWTNINDGGLSPQYSGANTSLLTISNTPFTSNGCSFRCMVSTLAGDVFSDPALLTVYPQPVAYIVGDTAICEGNLSSLTVAGNANSFLWSTGDTTQNIIVYPLPPSQNYSVTVSNNFNCTNTAQIDVHVTETFYVTLTNDFEPDNTIYTGQIITFTALPPGYHNYAFLVGTDTIQSSASNIFSTNSISNGEMVTVIASVNNCYESDSVVIIVKNIPSAFTPYNKDGKNDIFCEGVDLIMLNRWGQILYEGRDGWDGTYNGRLVSPGTYFFNITFNKDTEVSFSVRGAVLIVAANN